MFPVTPVLCSRRPRRRIRFIFLCGLLRDTSLHPNPIPPNNPHHNTPPANTTHPASFRYWSPYCPLDKSRRWYDYPFQFESNEVSVRLLHSKELPPNRTRPVPFALADSKTLYPSIGVSTRPPVLSHFPNCITPCTLSVPLSGVTGNWVLFHL